MPSPISEHPPEDGRPRRFRLRDIEFTEEWVDDAVHRAGGFRIAKRHSFPEGVKNCDYRLGRLFIELKFLERDAIEAPERQEKIVALFKEAGMFGDGLSATIDTSRLPPDVKRSYWEIYLSGVERLAAEANRQIKATTRHLAVTDFKGVILFVNKECETIETETLKRYAEHLIKKENYSSLHYVLCFTAIPGVAEGHSPVIGFMTGPTETDEDRSGLDAIQSQFKAKIEDQLGKKLAAAPDHLGLISNVREDRSFTLGDTQITLSSASRLAAEQNLRKMRAPPPEA